MALYTDALLEDLQALPGAGHSFLKQIAAPDGAPHRAWIEAALATVEGPLADRWSEMLCALDNTRFFQGWGELATTEVLAAHGWRVRDLVWPGPSLAARDPAGRAFHLMVLSFVQQVRPADRDAIRRMVRALERVGSRARIIVLVRRWLPHDFDPEPVRRAIDMWLREVDRAGWEGRYAEYRDEHVSLEFALTGEQAREGQGVVALALGPFDAHRTVAAVEQRLVTELDMNRLGAWSDQPLVVACVADQPWNLPPGYVRELLYGKPVAQATSPDAPRYTATFGPEFTPSVFRDPLYRTVSALLLLERPPGGVAPVAARAYLNPWAERPLPADALPGDVFAPHHLEGDRPVMAWVSR